MKSFKSLFNTAIDNCEVNDYKHHNFKTKDRSFVEKKKDAVC